MEKYPTDIKFWPKVSVYDVDFRKDLLLMANCITQLNLWNWLKNYQPEDGCGFMFSSHENINKISRMTEASGHSGATFGFAMRCMQLIATEGFDSLCDKFKK